MITSFIIHDPAGPVSALRMPEPENRHTTSAQPIRMIRFHVPTRERPSDGPSVAQLAFSYSGSPSLGSEPNGLATADFESTSPGTGNTAALDNDHLLIGIELACWAWRDFHDIFSSLVLSSWKNTVRLWPRIFNDAH